MPDVKCKKSMTKLLATKIISYSDILEHQRMIKCSNCDGELLTFFPDDFKYCNYCGAVFCKQEVCYEK